MGSPEIQNYVARDEAIKAYKDQLRLMRLGSGKMEYLWKYSPEGWQDSLDEERMHLRAIQEKFDNPGEFDDVDLIRPILGNQKKLIELIETILKTY